MHANVSDDTNPPEVVWEEGTSGETLKHSQGWILHTLKQEKQAQLGGKLVWSIH